MTVTISSVIPTHNRPEGVVEAARSVTSQERAVDLVIVDDGSDPPVDIDRLPSETRLVRHSKPRGPASARNAGVAVSESEWVAFLDDDDRWASSKIEAVSAAISQFPDARVVFHTTAYEYDKYEASPRLVSDPLKRVLHSQPPHLSGVAVRRDVHDGVKFDESMWATQDLDYLIRLAIIGGTWVEIPRILSIHASRDNQGSAIDIESRIEGRLSLLDKHGDLIRGDRRAHAFYFARLGHQYRRAGQIGNARESFIRSMKLNPMSQTAWKGLLRSLFNQGFW